MLIKEKIKLNRSIFREYDVRGIVGETLNYEDAYNIGAAFATCIVSDGNSLIVVGRDGRLSSTRLKESLVRGLMSAGANVLDIGLVPTPVTYFASKYYKAAGSVTVTGSHNPPEYNGFKLTKGHEPFFGEEITTLADIIENKEFKTDNGTHQEADSQELKQAYIDRLLSQIDKNKKLNVIWDPGNGATSEFIAEICDHLRGNNIIINRLINGRFPGRSPDPTEPENIKELISKVVRYNFDMGIAFDGDGDRVVVVDSKGNVLKGDELLLIFATEMLKKKQSTVITDVKTSQAIFNKIKELGGNAIMWKTGHSFIKQKMRETKADIAGEVSGHIFFADNYNFDDGIYAAIRLYSIISEGKTSLHELYKNLPKTLTSEEIRIECNEEEKFQLINNIKQSLQEDNVKFIDIDGVRIINENSWWTIRASNTQNCLTARYEASSLVEKEKVLAQMKHYLSNTKFQIK